MSTDTTADPPDPGTQGEEQPVSTTPAVSGTPVYPGLAGKIAVVTGGSGAIGAATAAVLAASGVAVCVVGRNQAALDGVADQVRSRGGHAIAVAADCTVEADVEALRAQVEARLGAPEIVCAFAGGDGRPVATHTETAEHWRRVTDSALTSTFLTIAAFLPAMIEARREVIVTMASAAARQAARSSAAYAAAKAGVIALSRHLAGEYAHAGIRVNCLAPSAIENDKMRSSMSDEQRRALGAAFPLGRIGRPEDVAAAAAFLASAGASWITGVTLDISGGKVML
jgi:3-oxoacyl-[acyl-carrier protein] reductase